MIRVLVKASSPIAKAGLESLLQAHPAFQLMKNSSDGGPAAEPESSPDVMVVEAETLEDHSVRDAVDWAAAGGPVVLLAWNTTPEAVREALRAGIRAVLPRDLGGSEIVAAVEATAAGFVIIDGADVETLLRPPSAASTGSADMRIEPLTPREIEVLRLVAAGLANKEIASRLEISEHTVKFHVASVMGKLGAASRTGAVTLGIHHGFIMV